MKPLSKFLISLLSPLTLIALLLSLLGSAVFAAPVQAASFTVTKTADTNDGVCNADCSLREAISAANASPGADTIILPAGTYQLTLANAGGVNEDNNATGDLDVLDSLTIQGAGAGSTIIEAGTNTSNGIDKVFALNPICSSPINVTIDGVTIRFGRNTQPSGAADFSFTGGGIDWCSAGAGGTFTLSNSVVSDNTNVNGYGGGLNVDTVSSPTTVNISNVTFSNNQTLSTTQTANGAAINLFGDSPTINITNSTFTGNHTTNPTSGGGAIYFRPTTVGHLSISGSTFTTNTAAGIGGAIATDSHGAGTTISIQNSTFTGNTATNAFGGALNLDGTNVNTTPFSLAHLTITGNTAGQAGGGLFIGNSNVSMSQSLIVGNSAPTASGLRKSVDAATATVTNNWWGCSTGPGAAPCDTASTAGGTLNFTPWYRDQLTAATSPLGTNQSTALTASFLTNSANTAVPVADLAEIVGRSVTWAATNGNLSSTQSTVQATGTATGSFQATAAGTAIISAKVDNDNTAPVSSNVLSLPVNKADTTAAITNGAALSGTPSVTGEPVAVNFSVTGAFGNSPTAPTGNVTVSAGADSCTGTVAAGTCNLTFKTAGAKTLTATYAGDSNFNASPASATVSHTVNKADTTTTITTVTPEPSVTGQTVTFNVVVAAVAPGAAVSPTTITGTVNVTDGGTNTCTATLTAGVGSCTIAFPTPGSYNMAGLYSGDDNFNGSTSGNSAHTVNKADTTTTITSDNPDPSSVGQAVTVNFSVAANAPGAGTPTGNVSVTAGADSCSGSLSGGPTATGSCSITLNTTGAKTLTASYAGDSNFNGSLSAAEPHSVDQPPAITSANHTTFTVGSTGSFAVTADGFPAPTFSETGPLPSGVTFTSNGDGTATLSGAPAAGSGGVYTFTITATNGVAPDAQQSFTLTVLESPAFTSANAAYFTVGSAGSFTITTSGYPKPTIIESGALPSGLTFTDNGDGTAKLAGTPAAGTGGAYPLTLTAGNTVGSDATQNFTLTINQAPAITSADHAAFAEGQAGTFTVTTTGSPTPSLSETGALPSGVSFTDNGNGTATLGGTPASGTAGTYPLTISAHNGAGADATQSFTLTVNPPLAITSANHVTFTVGSAGTFTVTTIGTPAPTLSEGGTLPGGVTFTDNGDGTGTLSGTPAAGTGGIYPITFTAHNSAAPDSTQNFTLTVNQAPVITSANHTDFLVGLAGSFNVTTSGFPAAALSESGALPGGVTFTDNGNGTATLSGTPAAGSGGVYSLTLKASNGVGSDATQNFTLTVSQAPAITSANNVTFVVGTAGSFNVTATGYPAPTFSESGALPGGVTFTSAGVLSGTPAAGSGGVYPLTITASNGVGAPTQAFTLTVNEAPAITSANTTSVTEGQALSFSVTTTGYPKPALTKTGTLPSGVTFVDNGNGTATLSGTPPVGTAGTYPLTITAQNGVGSSAVQTFSLVVNPANHPPSWAVTGGICSGINLDNGTVNLTLTDLDNDPVTLALVSNSNTKLLPNANIVLGGSGYNRTLTVTGAPKQSGKATLTFNLSDGKATVPVVITVIIGTSNNETLNGTSGDDMIFGGGGSDTINGNAGDDLLCGSNGTDTLNGGDGNDILDGENGNDILNGGNGNDILRGSAGNDRLTGGPGADFFSGGSGTDVATDFTPSQGDTQDGTIP